MAWVSNYNDKVIENPTKKKNVDASKIVVIFLVVMNNWPRIVSIREIIVLSHASEYNILPPGSMETLHNFLNKL